jgi:hypothetical protein
VASGGCVIGVRGCEAAWNEWLKVERGVGDRGDGAVHSLKNPGSTSALEWLIITKQVIVKTDKDNIEIEMGDVWGGWGPERGFLRLFKQRLLT